MSWDTVPGRNGEGYPDPTAAPPLHECSIARKASRASEPVNTSRI